MAPLPLGTAILRRYVLIGVAGRGGVSTVYHAVDARRGRRIAVKILAPTWADDSCARDDVRREAVITDRLRHPSVPRVFEYGDAPLPDGRVVAYVVLELLTGIPLADRLAAGPLPWPEAVRIAATAADVLAIAHRRGVVHRDLTSRNIMMTPDGVKIIDFGLATAAPARIGHPTHQVLVKRPVRNRDRVPARPLTTAARPADDVYTLGVLLYEMLIGRSPYPGGRPAAEVSGGRFPRPAPTPVLAVPGLPRALADLVRACMAKTPEARPRSAAAALALWDLLDRYGGPPAARRSAAAMPTPVL